MKVALFITCLTDTFYPRTGIAVVKVLEHLGCEVAFPQAQTCCGQPMWNSGYHDDAKALARRMIEVFEPYDCVVTPSGSCAAMIRDYYAEMFEHDHAWEHGAQAMAAKTYEFNEFLQKVLKVDLKELGVKWEGKATYHYSCHLRGIGVRDEPIQMLQQVEGLEYVPMDKMDQCCGFGGTFAMKYPKISGMMVNDKADRIKETQAPVCVSNDAGCTMNISGACHRREQDVKFITLAEIIAEGLGLLEASS